ncbi:bacitracin resistance protein [Microbacterium candidum]|uniref:Bacitracin resistance protein n=1 Tax=Microbacterium candidum TaxID=3041922 RepID=A0ABT7N081_9MICO|nr:bacitracin resistance protein [Microbacterium sp. ASV49]MDL9980118.1 bacitracin resistance protein [Microbacterium sp. ASV49]
MMTTDASTSGRPERRAAMPTWLIAVIAAAFGLFYAYALWNAVAFLISQASGPLGLNGYGWFVLLLPVVLPILVFAGAFALGWRRRALPFAAILLTGLALVSVFWLDIVAYSAVYGGSLLGS